MEKTDDKKYENKINNMAVIANLFELILFNKILGSIKNFKPKQIKIIFDDK